MDPLQSGYPVLTRRHQASVKRFLDMKVQLCLSGRAQVGDGLRAYTNYLLHLQARREAKSDQQMFEEPYYDYLQAPLQPLADNLESQTYETFERDPVKYVQYEEAVYLALMDRLAQQADVRTVIMVRFLASLYSSHLIDRAGHRCWARPARVRFATCSGTGCCESACVCTREK